MPCIVLTLNTFRCYIGSVLFTVLKGIENNQLLLETKAVGRCFRLGGPNVEGARTVQVGPGTCSPGKIFDF